MCEYQYDTTRYYRGDREGGTDLVMLDSPALPDTRSPGHQYGSSLGRLSRMMGEEGFSEGEDLNEDVLYLRLIALRSRAVGEKREQGELEGSKLAMDIQELLEEAEVTANEEAEAAETCN